MHTSRCFQTKFYGNDEHCQGLLAVKNGVGSHRHVIECTMQIHFIVILCSCIYSYLKILTSSTMCDNYAEFLPKMSYCIQRVTIAIIMVVSWLFRIATYTSRRNVIEQQSNRRWIQYKSIRYTFLYPVTLLDIPVWHNTETGIHWRKAVISMTSLIYFSYFLQNNFF